MRLQPQYVPSTEQQWGSGGYSCSPQTTRVPCSKQPWKPQPARPQKPPNALRNAADSPSAAWAPQDARGTARPGVGTADAPRAATKDEQAEAASTPAGGTPAAPAKEPEAASPPAGGTPAVMQQAVKAVKTEADAASTPPGGTPARSVKAEQADSSPAGRTPAASATSASAPPPWTRPPNEQAMRTKALNEFAKRPAGDELQSSAKRHKPAPWARSNPHPANMEESSDDEVQEEVKEEEDSEDPSSDDEEDWLAKGPRGDFAHGCPSEL